MFKRVPKGILRTLTSIYLDNLSLNPYEVHRSYNWRALRKRQQSMYNDKPLYMQGPSDLENGTGRWLDIQLHIGRYIDKYIYVVTQVER